MTELIICQFFEAISSVPTTKIDKLMDEYRQILP